MMIAFRLGSPIVRSTVISKKIGNVSPTCFASVATRFLGTSKPVDFHQANYRIEGEEKNPTLTVALEPGQSLRTEFDTILHSSGPLDHQRKRFGFFDRIFVHDYTNEQEEAVDVTLGSTLHSDGADSPLYDITSVNLEDYDNEIYCETGGLLLASGTVHIQRHMLREPVMATWMLKKLEGKGKVFLRGSKPVRAVHLKPREQLRMNSHDLVALSTDVQCSIEMPPRQHLQSPHSHCAPRIFTFTGPGTVWRQDGLASWQTKTWQRENNELQQKEAVSSSGNTFLWFCFGWIMGTSIAGQIAYWPYYIMYLAP